MSILKEIGGLYGGCFFRLRWLDDITYEYYDGGALKKKTVGASTITNYGYDLRGRLTSLSGAVSATYTYDPSGIRVSAGSTTYLTDPYNHTGYAQVFKETTSGTPTVYTIGSDIIAQAVGSNSSTYLLYDGHGSVRQQTNSSGTVTNTFNYDAYGNAIGFTPSNSLLYSGEMYNVASETYYLRTRDYRPTTGRFNQVDTYAGNNEDPISLNKYLYCSANPVNGTDPSGMYDGLAGLTISTSINMTLRGMYHGIGYVAAIRSVNRLLGAQTLFNIANTPREQRNATIIVHGIGMHSYGWTDSFVSQLKNRAEHQDYYEFTWSGFAMTGTVGIEPLTHTKAVSDLRDSITAIQRKRYENVNIIAHSWGTVLSLSAQQNAGVGEINTWFTMGSPLSQSINAPPVQNWYNFYNDGDPVIYLSGNGLYKRNKGVKQFGYVDSYGLQAHSSYWTNPYVLNTIGNSLSGQ